MHYGYHLNPDISEPRMIGMLREVEEDLHRKRNKQINGYHISSDVSHTMSQCKVDKFGQ